MGYARRIGLVFLLVLAACSAGDRSELMAGHALRDLFDARQRWESVSYSKPYTFVYKRECYCALHGNDISVVVDWAGEVKRFSLSNQSLTEETTRIFSPLIRTIPDLFNEALGLIEDSLEEGTELKVEYDAEYGVPKRIDWKSAKNDGHSGSSTLEVLEFGFE